MKTTFYATSIALAISTIVQADNCSPNLVYCGHSLMGKGNYRGQLDQVYQDVFHRVIVPNDGDPWNNDLFFCAGGRSGLVGRIETCPTGVCVDNGNGKNDTCGSGFTDQVPLVA